MGGRNFACRAVHRRLCAAAVRGVEDLHCNRRGRDSGRGVLGAGALRRAEGGPRRAGGAVSPPEWRAPASGSVLLPRPPPGVCVWGGMPCRPRCRPHGSCLLPGPRDASSDEGAWALWRFTRWGVLALDRHDGRCVLVPLAVVVPLPHLAGQYSWDGARASSWPSRVAV